MLSARANDLKSENATLRKQVETSYSTHAKVETGLAEDLVETNDDLRKKARKYNVLKAKESKLKEELPTLCDVAKVSNKKLKGLQLLMVSNGMDIAHIASLLQDHHLNCHRVTAKNCELQKKQLTWKENFAGQ